MKPFSKPNNLFLDNPLLVLSKHSVLLPLLLLFSISIKAQEFKSIAAKAAQEKYEATIKKAKADYIKELDAALQQAYKTNSLDEANLISDELIKLRGGEAKAEPSKVEKPKTDAQLQKENRKAIVGTWKRDLCTLVFKEDGTFTDTTRNLSGTWELIDESGNFKMIWTEGNKTVLCPKPVNGITKDDRGLTLTKEKDKK